MLIYVIGVTYISWELPLFVLEILGTGGLKLLLQGFQAYHSIGCDQDEGAV